MQFFLDVKWYVEDNSNKRLLKVNAGASPSEEEGSHIDISLAILIIK